MGTHKHRGAIRAVWFRRDELPAPVENQCESLYSRLQFLSAKGTLNAVERREWENRVNLAECQRSFRDTYLEFSTWAAETEATLTPFFRVRECYVPGRADCDDWLVLPAMCLAVYHDGALDAVYPHKVGDRTRSVVDGIEQLEAELDAPAPPGQRRPEQIEQPEIDAI